MADLFEPLLRLQTLDVELFRLRTEQRQKPLELEQVKQRVAQQDAATKVTDQQLKALQNEHKQKELDLSTRETSVKKFQGQLFQVKTNKEYSAMQHEIDQTKADISLLEEEIIKLLESVDQAKREHVGQLEILKREQETLRAEQQRIERDLGTIQGRVAELEQQRQTIAPSVPKDSLALYERVRNSRPDSALAPLIKESCGGCYMLQPPQVINEVHLKARLVTCEACNRILYVDESGG